jgi:hypothetical protein
MTVTSTSIRKGMGYWLCLDCAEARIGRPLIETEFVLERGARIGHRGVEGELYDPKSHRPL